MVTKLCEQFSSEQLVPSSSDPEIGTGVVRILGDYNRYKSIPAKPTPVIQQTSSFLNLPLDIRLLIYDQVFYRIVPVGFTGRRHGIRMHKYNPCPDIVDIFEKLYRKYGMRGSSIEPFFIMESDHNNVLADAWIKRPDRCATCGSHALVYKFCWKCNDGFAGLLYACRQVYKETIENAYAHTRFQMRTAAELVHFIRAMRSHQSSWKVQCLELFMNLSHDFWGDFVDDFADDPWADTDKIYPREDKSIGEFLRYLEGGALAKEFPNLKFLKVSFDYWMNFTSKDDMGLDDWLLREQFSNCRNLSVTVRGITCPVLSLGLAHAIETDAWFLLEHSCEFEPRNSVDSGSLHKSDQSDSLVRAKSCRLDTVDETRMFKEDEKEVAKIHGPL